jgi:hypothetical protein
MEPHKSFVKAEDRAGHHESLSRRLTGPQQAAIRLAAEIGDHIRKDYPTIAEEYRSGLTASELVVTHGFDHCYGVSRQAAIAAVRNAIRGYSGRYYETYPGLIADRSERDKLAFAHNRRTGIEVYERQLGIHGLTPEQIANARRKGGLIQGPLSYQLRIGCHALPPEAVREQCRKIASLGGKVGGVACVVAKGMVPYVPATGGRVSEIEFAFRLAADPRYVRPGRTDFGKLAARINEVFHAGVPFHSRTRLKIALQRYRRHCRSGAESPADTEMSFAAKLACDTAYQFPGWVKAAEIASKVNEEYHDSKPVRNPVGIRAAIQRYRRQTSSPKAA